MRFFPQNRAMSQLEQAMLQSKPRLHKCSTRFAVNGGAISGIEVAGEITNILHSSLDQGLIGLNTFLKYYFLPAIDAKSFFTTETQMMQRKQTID